MFVLVVPCCPHFYSQIVTWSDIRFIGYGHQSRFIVFYLLQTPTASTSAIVFILVMSPTHCRATTARATQNGRTAGVPSTHGTHLVLPILLSTTRLLCVSRIRGVAKPSLPWIKSLTPSGPSGHKASPSRTNTMPTKSPRSPR